MRKVIRLFITAIIFGITLSVPAPAQAYTGVCVDTDVFKVWFIKVLADPPFHFEAALFGDDPQC
jgi:hypothetical protein